MLTFKSAWSGFVYQKPSAPVSLKGSPLEQVVAEQTSEKSWRVYTKICDDDDDDDDEEKPMRPSHALEVASEYAKLFRIVHETILIYCGSRGKVSAESLLKLYKRYLHWKDNLPPEIAAVELSMEPMPSVLILQYGVHPISFLRMKTSKPFRSPKSRENLG